MGLFSKLPISQTTVWLITLVSIVSMAFVIDFERHRMDIVAASSAIIGVQIGWMSFCRRQSVTLFCCCLMSLVILLFSCWRSLGIHDELGCQIERVEVMDMMCLRTLAVVTDRAKLRELSIDFTRGRYVRPKGRRLQYVIRLTLKNGRTLVTYSTYDSGVGTYSGDMFDIGSQKIERFVEFAINGGGNVLDGSPRAIGSMR